MVNASAVGRISVPSGVSGRRAFNVPPARTDPSVVGSVAELDAARLAHGLKGLMRHAQDTCGLRVVSPSVQLVEYSNKAGRRLGVHGVHTCKSPLCPLCAPKWQRTRSDEISRAIDNHGADRVFFVTLTMRHNKRMHLGLMHRLLTSAYGNLWGGKAGEAASRKLGGKPESIRAHDRTWSDAHGWHPHVHSLMFVDDGGLDVGELATMLDKRWPKLLVGSLKRFRRLCDRIVQKSGCKRHGCRVCYAPQLGPRRESSRIGPMPDGEQRVWYYLDPPLEPWLLAPGEQQGECAHFRERGERLFGVRMFPRERRRKDGTKEPVSIHDSALRVLAMLADFTEGNITPTRARGAFVERVRDIERLPKYLAKMGLELASSLDKLGKTGSDGLKHYGLWQVARLACAHGDPLRGPARKAWKQLFFATFGTQTITFSDRDALGLPEDSYVEGEPAEADPGNVALNRVAETSQVIGQIVPAVYRQLAAEKGHGVLSELRAAYVRGELGELAYVDAPDGDIGRPLERSPPGRDRAPPATAGPTELDASGYLTERPDWGLRGVVLSPVERAAAIGPESAPTFMREAYSRASALPSISSVRFVEQILKNLQELIYGRE